MGICWTSIPKSFIFAHGFSHGNQPSRIIWSSDLPKKAFPTAGMVMLRKNIKTHRPGAFTAPHDVPFPLSTRSTCGAFNKCNKSSGSKKISLSYHGIQNWKKDKKGLLSAGNDGERAVKIAQVPSNRSSFHAHVDKRSNGHVVKTQNRMSSLIGQSSWPSILASSMQQPIASWSSFSQSNETSQRDFSVFSAWGMWLLSAFMVKLDESSPNACFIGVQVLTLGEYPQ